MIINDLDDYYIVFDTKNRNTELDTLIVYTFNKITKPLNNKTTILKIDILFSKQPTTNNQ